VKALLAVILGLGGTVAGFIAGALAGMDIFGNYFVRATFFGVRGYEAGFWYGGISGGLIGLVLGLLLYCTVRRRQKDTHNKD
jgi:prolipoprotein diacylglyceryltransferase